MNVIYYVIHNTHSLSHINNSMHSFHQQQYKLVWDKLVIKNSITDQISNETISKIIKKYELLSVFSTIEFVPAGTVNTTYSDLKDAVIYAQNINASFLLFSKAEYCYSINSFSFFRELFLRSNTDWVFTPPVINATELANEKLIESYLLKEQFVEHDEITGYDGDDLHRISAKPESTVDKLLYKLKIKKREQQTGDISNRKIDESKTYQLIAHNVVLDINVHLFGRNAVLKMDFINDELNMQWGRIRAMDRLLETGTEFILTKKCFVVHLFHEIPGARLGRNIKGIKY